MSYKGLISRRTRPMLCRLFETGGFHLSPFFRGWETAAEFQKDQVGLYRSRHLRFRNGVPLEPRRGKRRGIRAA